MKKIFFVSLMLLCSYDSYSQGTWTQKANILGAGRFWPASFSIGTKGYMGTGATGGTNYRDFWEWDQMTNTWSQKANFGGAARYGAAAFAIGNKGYMGTGDASGYSQDFWEYDPALNTWTAKASFAGSGRRYAAGFSIGSKGYIGTGYDGVAKQDFWEYDPVANSWVQKAPFPGLARYLTASFGIGTKGYIGTGYNGSNYQDFYEWDQGTNTWTQKANFGGGVWVGSVSFSIGTKGYVGTGGAGAGVASQALWEWDQATNTWLQKANFGGLARTYAFGFAIGSKGYIGSGWDGAYYQDFWEWGACVAAPAQPGAINGSITICSGSTNTYSIAAVNGATSYSWTLPNGWSGTSVTNSISATANATSGNVTVTANNACGSSTAQTLAITVNSTPLQPGAISGPAAVCENSSNTYSITAVAGASSYTWTLPAGWSGSSVTNSINATTGTNGGSITVVAINACGTSQAQTLTLTVNPVYTTNTTAAICQGDSLLLGGAYRKTAGSFTDLLQSIKGCDSTVVTALSVNPLPAVSLANQTAVCANAGAFTLTGGAPAGGTYSGTGVTNNQFDPSVAGAGTHTIIYSYTDANTGCSKSASNTILVNPLPTVTMAGMNALCADNPAISLTNGLPTGGTYSGPGVSNAMFNPAVAGAGTHTITYSYTDPNTGCSNSTSKTITVNPLPAVPTISTNGSTFTSSAATGNQWYLNGNAVNGATNQTFTCTGNGNYTVCVTDANGCKSCSAVLNFTTFSISENQSAHDIAVYPNPFSGELTITAGGRTGTVAIYNTLGEKIYSSQITDQSLTINLGEVPKGIYFVRVSANNETTVRKIIKQ